MPDCIYQCSVAQLLSIQENTDKRAVLWRMWHQPLLMSSLMSSAIADIDPQLASKAGGRRRRRRVRKNSQNTKLPVQIKRQTSRRPINQRGSQVLDEMLESQPNETFNLGIVLADWHWHNLDAMPDNSAHPHTKTAPYWPHRSLCSLKVVHSVTSLVTVHMGEAASDTFWRITESHRPDS